jgi:hypothetical protein
LNFSSHTHKHEGPTTNPKGLLSQISYSGRKHHANHSLLITPTMVL